MTAVDRVGLIVADGVAEVRLERPERHNALDREMYLALDRAISDLELRDDVRAVVLSGSGPSFCSGLDVTAFIDADDDPSDLLHAGDARMALREVQFGLMPDMAVSHTLRRLARIDVAKDLALTGRTICADEAERVGLVTRLADDPYAAASELARDIARWPAAATRAIKQVFNATGEAPPDRCLARFGRRITPGDLRSIATPSHVT